MRDYPRVAQGVRSSDADVPAAAPGRSSSGWLRGPSAEETRQRDWEEQTGPAWETYVECYQAGWARGCEAGSRWVRNQLPQDRAQQSPPVGCGTAPTSPDFNIPLSPPDDPQTAGVEDGVTEGCAYAFRQMREENDRPCYLTAVLLNAEQRFVYPRDQP
jgi:hypothetical protein